MHNLKTAWLSMLFVTAGHAVFCQSTVGKTQQQIINQWGDSYKRLRDAGGMPVLQYKKPEAKDTVTYLLYFERSVCVKEVQLRPQMQKAEITDSLNRAYKPAGFNSWFDIDSNFITLSTRDGFLDITSFSSAYYKKLAH